MLQQARADAREGAKAGEETSVEQLPPWEKRIVRDPPSQRLHSMLKSLSFELMTRASLGEEVEDLYAEARVQLQKARAAQAEAESRAIRLDALLKAEKERSATAEARVSTLRGEIEGAKAAGAEEYRHGPQFQKDLTSYGVECYDIGLQEGEVKAEAAFNAALKACQHLTGDNRLPGILYADYAAYLQEHPVNGAFQPVVSLPATEKPPAPEAGSSSSHPATGRSPSGQ